MYLLVFSNFYSETKTNYEFFKKALIFPVPISDEAKKLTEVFIFILRCGASKEIRGTTKKCENLLSEKTTPPINVCSVLDNSRLH